MTQPLLKLTFIPGLKQVVLNEISSYPPLRVVEESDSALYLEYTPNFSAIWGLKSVLNVYVVQRDTKLNPSHISKHKSILGGLINIALSSTHRFNTFRLSCAGSQSPEVREIERYIHTHYKLSPAEDADLEIYIGKLHFTWELGVRLTSRPLSVRSYRVANIPGGLNPTVAYAMNTFCNLSNTRSYLNIFSGSGTLPIEAALINQGIEFLGFDHNGKTNSQAIQNIKKAGLIKSVHLKRLDMFDNPEVGTYDAIVSDLPFGMQISKNEDLEKLYQCFIDYCEKTLNPGGRLVVYTAEYELLHRLLMQSKFTITKTLHLQVPTNEGSYLNPRIYVCSLK